MKYDLSNIKYNYSDKIKQIRLPTEMSTQLAEETGLHLGDGSMNFYNQKGFYQLRGHIKDDKEHYFTRVKSLYKKLYNLDINIREMKSTGVIGFQIWSDAIVSFKKNIVGLPLGRKNELTIPKIINQKHFFFSFLKGLFDTDGTIYIENKRGKPYPRIEMKLVNKKLIQEIYKNLIKLGIRATYHEYERKEKNWRDLHCLSIRGYIQSLKWMRLIGSNNPKHIEKFKFIYQKWVPKPSIERLSVRYTENHVLSSIFKSEGIKK